MTPSQLGKLLEGTDDDWAGDVLSRPPDRVDIGSGAYVFKIHAHEFDTKGTTVAVDTDDAQEALDIYIDWLSDRPNGQNAFLTAQEEADLRNDGFLGDYLQGGNEGKYLNSLYATIKQL